MTTAESVRAAYVAVADALVAAGRRQEAAEMLHRALAEHGEDPPRWRIRQRLSEVADDNVGAVSELLDAVLEAPAHEVDEPAEAALRLLDGDAANKLDPAQIDSVLACARAGSGASPSLVSLAAMLLLLRGDVDTTASLMGSTAVRAANEPAIETAQTVVRAFKLIDEGRFAEASALLGPSPEVEREPETASARALALYGEGDLDAALKAASAAPTTFSTAVATAIIWLRRLVTPDWVDPSVDPAAQASKAASMAARLDPSRSEGLLLRAQVELEATFDIDAGRRLLEHAVPGLKGGDPDTVRHWRLQRRVRTDDVFRYVSLEVSAACNRTDELMALGPGDLPLHSTDQRQDAALAQLLARTHDTAGDPVQAAAFFEAAAQLYSGVDAERSLAARREVTRLRPTVGGLIALADDLWQASYDLQVEGGDKAQRAVDDGLAAIDRLEQRGLEVAPGDHIEGAYRRGLLLARRAEIADGALLDLWLPLPWLLAAALEDPDDSYRAAHLAWALNDTGLGRAALHFAERANELREGDTWLQETRAVMLFNWYGLLDASSRDFVAGHSNRRWSNTMFEIDALNRGDTAELRMHQSQPGFDSIWARVLRAQSTAQVDGVEAATPLFRALLDDAATARTDPDVAADCALFLRDPDAALRYVEAGVAANRINGYSADVRRAAIAVITGGSDERLVEIIRHVPDPGTLREMTSSTFPILCDAYADQAEIVERLRSLQREARRLLTATGLPPLTIELDLGFRSSTDPALDRLVHAMLRAEERGDAREASTALGLRALAGETAVLGGALSAFESIASSPWPTA